MDNKRDYNFSHTMLANWRRCRYRFQLAYIDKVPSKAGIGQLKGSAGHAGLAAWYETSLGEVATEKAWAVYHAGLIQNGMSLGDFELVEWEELAQALERYFVYSTDNDDFTWVASELEFNLSYKQFNFRGFIDGIVKDSHGQTWLLENKFNKRVYTQHLDLDPQVSIYMLASRMLGYEPTGVLYNIIRMGGGKTAEKEPVVRKRLYRNPEGLMTVAEELQNQMEEVDEWINDPNRRVYRNATKDCTWDCSFYKVCLGVEDTGSGQEVIDMMKMDFGNREVEA